MDRFQEMQAFAAVVDAGSFVRAAESLKLSKTAVSRLVADLEARLGTRLLRAPQGRHVLPQRGSEARPALDGDVGEEDEEEDDAHGEAEEEDPAERLVDEGLALTLEIDG